MSIKRCICAALVVVMPAAFSAAKAEGDPKRGAKVYRACVACHSLEPDLHLTGPSLAGLWEKKVASVADFPRYSKALKSRGFVWDEVTLNAWIADPDAFVKDSSMTFRGVKEDKARIDLIAFLQLALSTDAKKSGAAKSLLSDGMARGQAPEPLDRVGPAGQVTSVRHCQNSYFVVTADGNERAFWEQNLRLKVDSGPTGPRGGKPVLIGSGMQGDRASLVFSDPAQISTFVQSKC
jgi:cytochrome c